MKWLRALLLAGALSGPALGQNVQTGAPPVSAVQSWTPTDASGAGLAFTGVSASWQQIGNMIFAYGSVTYPSTADTHNATIGGLPANFLATVKGEQCFITVTNAATLIRLFPQAGTATMLLVNGTATSIQNSAMSTSVVTFECIYPAT